MVISRLVYVPSLVVIQTECHKHGFFPEENDSTILTPHYHRPLHYSFATYQLWLLTIVSRFFGVFEVQGPRKIQQYKLNALPLGNAQIPPLDLLMVLIWPKKHLD